MDYQIPAESGWENCPDGKIGNFTSRLKARQRRSPVRFSYVAVLAVLSGILAVQLSEASQMELERLSRKGGVSCTEVLANIDRYIRGEITGEFRSQMGFHLSNCPHCARTVRGVAKKDVLSGLFSGLSSPHTDMIAAAPRTNRKRCDIDAPVRSVTPRTPIVAQKVLAAAGQ